MKKVFFWLSAFLVCGGCSLSPTSEQAASFGKSADTALTMLTNARAVEGDLALHTEIETRACNYLKENIIGFAAHTTGPVSAAYAPQIELLQAITEYAQALSKATDPKLTSDLESAAGKLTASSGTFVKSLPSASSSPIFGPAINVVSSVAINLVEIDTRQRIRNVVEQTDPFLQTAAIKLLKDLEPVESRLRVSYQKWLGEKECILRSIRSSPELSKAVIYKVYIDADQEARNFSVRLDVLAKRGKILGALLDAHYQLLSTDVDFDASLSKLQSVITELQALQKAAQPSASAGGK
jgi:hypothetical protein